MGRRKGSLNKEVAKPEQTELDTEARIRLMADLLVEIAVKDEAHAA